MEVETAVTEKLLPARPRILSNRNFDNPQYFRYIGTKILATPSRAGECSTLTYFNFLTGFNKCVLCFWHFISTKEVNEKFNFNQNIQNAYWSVVRYLPYEHHSFPLIEFEIGWIVMRRRGQVLELLDPSYLTKLHWGCKMRVGVGCNAR